MAREEKHARFGSSSSWADEVEREEREEAQKRSIGFEVKTDGRKPNPFGAARPREVVLEEKGVDWRKLDQDLEHSHPNLRKDKKPKENIPLPLSPAPIIKHGSYPLGSSCMEQKKPYPAENTSQLVPPIMYAPKNIMALMVQIRRGRKDLMDAPVENSCSAHHIMNKEPIIPREEYYSDSRYGRNCFGERSFVADQQMHSNRRRQILSDLNMERANYEKYCDAGEKYNPQYGNYGAERRLSFAYGNQKSERTPARHCNDYRICDAERGDSNGRCLRSAGYGVRERTNPCTIMRDGGVDLRNDAISTKRRLAAMQPGPCHQRRRGKQCRK